jgi:hypothetical protein
MKKLYNISKEYLEDHYIKQQKTARQICDELKIKSKTVIFRLLKKYNIPLNSQYGKPNRNTKKFGEIHKSYICSLRLRAKNKNIDFNLDGNYLWRLFLKQKRKCILSGLDLIFPKAWGPKSKTDITASLDRINSKLGYIKGNVQWVHKTINTMKMNMNDKEFIYFCKKVADYS